MKKLPSLAALLLFSLVLRGAETKEQAKAKAALQELNDYIGTYKALGGPDKPRPEPKESWNEKLSWSWRFKGDDCWLRLEIDGGKQFKSGDLRFVPGKELYELTATTAAGQTKIFTGKLRDG